LLIVSPYPYFAFVSDVPYRELVVLDPSRLVLISFAGNGTLIISPAADVAALRLMNVPVAVAYNAGRFTPEQHRDEVFRKAATGGS